MTAVSTPGREAATGPVSGHAMPRSRPRLSAAVITLNEESRLRPCLESLEWADEIVIVDSGSTDRTLDVARAFTDRVVVHPFSGYGSQKNVALSHCRGEWVLSVDADERVPAALRAEIEAILAGNPVPAAFEVGRQNLFGGIWLRHGGLYPDYQVRLLRRGRTRFRERVVHESVEVQGSLGRLRTPLVHESYRGVAEFVARANRYSDLAARELSAQGRGDGVLDLLARPAWRFFSMYVLRLGFLDGWPGLVVAVLYAHYVFLRAAKTRELSRTAVPGPSGP